MSQNIQENLNLLSLPIAPEILDNDTKEQELKKKMLHQYRLRQYYMHRRDIYTDAIINANEKRDEFNEKWPEWEEKACTEPMVKEEWREFRDMLRNKYDIIYHCMWLVEQKEKEVTKIRNINSEIGHLKLLLLHGMTCDDSTGVRIYEYGDE